MTRTIDHCLQCGHALVDHRPIPGEAATSPVKTLECSVDGCGCNTRAEGESVQTDSPE
jgi:hypothetical protein